MSFFGGDINKAHWSVGLRYIHGEGRKEARERRESERLKLKEAGIKSTQYFQFNVNDQTAKEKQKAAAQAEAKRIEKLTGVKMDVLEGCFL